MTIDDQIRDEKQAAKIIRNNTVIIKVRYSIEPEDRIYVKGYGFLSFAENMGKDLSNKYS